MYQNNTVIMGETGGGGGGGGGGEHGFRGLGDLMEMGRHSDIRGGGAKKKRKKERAGVSVHVTVNVKDD